MSNFDAGGSADYEYGTGQQGLNYPNPYKLQNKFLIFKLITLGISVLILFLFAKFDLSDDLYLFMGIKLFLAFILLSYAISIAVMLSRQLRVYFGRGQPAGLASELSPDVVGTSALANQLKETIRQGAIPVETPTGALGGFLYSYFKDLIIAPKEIRNLMEYVCSNIVKMIIILSCFLLSEFFAYNSNASGWLGLFFMVVTSVLILKPLLQNKINHVSLSVFGFWKLLTLSIAIPIALIVFNKMYNGGLPNLAHLHFGFQSFVVIVCAIVADLFNIFALKKQLITPTGLTTAFEQDAITFNALPSQLTNEIQRKLQSEWTSTVPNRVYTRQTPDITNEQAGNFNGLIIEETQPVVPKELVKNFTTEEIKNNERLSTVYFIELLGVVMHTIGLLGIVITVLLLSKSMSINHLGWISISFGLMAISSYLMKIAHELWGRFDFESKLYIFEWVGSFTKAKMNFGNKFKDSVQSEKDIINIESMTLRVWVTHLNTVVFGHGINSAQNPRKIINMIGLKEDSKNWLLHIKNFAQSQSMLLNPTSNVDFERANSLVQLNAIASTSIKNENEIVDKRLMLGDE